MPRINKRNEIAAILADHREFLAARYGAKRIGVFGSVAKGTTRRRSDVDVLIEFERPVGFDFFSFSDYLESILGRKVDILTRAGLDAIRVKSVAKDIKKSLVYV